VVSVDTKKKELIGAFRNAGRTWRPEGVPHRVIRTLHRLRTVVTDGAVWLRDQTRSSVRPAFAITQLTGPAGLWESAQQLATGRVRASGSGSFWPSAWGSSSERRRLDAPEF
jgi:hypothetical protein